VLFQTTREGTLNALVFIFKVCFFFFEKFDSLRNTQAIQHLIPSFLTNWLAWQYSRLPAHSLTFKGEYYARNEITHRSGFSVAVFHVNDSHEQVMQVTLTKH